MVRIFPNRQASLWLVTALAWSRARMGDGRRYLDMGELEEQRREEREVVEGVSARGALERG